MDRAATTSKSIKYVQDAQVWRVSGGFSFEQLSSRFLETPLASITGWLLPLLSSSD